MPENVSESSIQIKKEMATEPPPMMDLLCQNLFHCNGSQDMVWIKQSVCHSSIVVLLVA